MRPRSVSRTPRALPIVPALLLVLGIPLLARATGPDLELDVARLARGVTLTTGIYHAPGRAPSLDATVPVSGACVLHPDENCVGGPGIRKLLRFDVLVHNRGDEDLVVGNPKERPDLFVFSTCHRHYHFRGAARYELLDGAGTLVKTGRKQGFCIEDTIPSTRETASPKRYDCGNQGVQVGWADFYPSVLDCQWIDVTDVPPGDYQLHVFWNPDHLMPETRLDNNEATVPVTIPVPTDRAPVVEEIRSPRTSTRAQAGRPLAVSWRAADDVKVVTQEIWLSTDDGSTWRQLVGDVPGQRSAFTVPIPIDAATEVARIKVVARDGSVQRGENVSEPFRIQPRAVRLPRLVR